MDVTRRDMLKGAGILAAGLAATGAVTALGCGTAGDAKPVTNLPENWDYEADIVVLGYGSAGVSAAREAAQAGSQVLVLEKMDEANAGGSSRCNGGWCAWGCWSIDNIIESSMGDISMEQAQRLKDESDHIVELLLETGMEFDSGLHSEAQDGVLGGAPAYYQAFLDTVAGLDIQVEYGADAQRLIYDGGEVRGVVAIQNGAEINVKARKAVIICTGCYLGNEKMVWDYVYPHMPYVSMTTPANTGQGLLMAQAIGAKTSKMHSRNIETYQHALKTASEEIGVGYPSNRSVPADFDCRIIVNSAGKRFISESMSLSHNKDQLPWADFPGNRSVGYSGYVNLPMWLIVDDNYMQNVPLGVRAVTTPWSRAQEVYDWSADNVEEIEKGWVLKADTLEELAALMTTDNWDKSAKITVDAEGLVAQVAEYNANCEAGGDPVFGKKNCVPLNKPPYYAAELLPAYIYTIGGLVADINQRTLDMFGEPIPRLYSAGDVGQNMDLCPISVPGCGAMGAIAGREASALEPWEQA